MSYDYKTIPIGSVCPKCRKPPTGAGGVCVRHNLYAVPAAELRELHKAPFLGHCIENRYVLVGRVGSGGMGAVYRARQLGIERDVAFKIMHAGQGATPAQRARFRREAQVIAGLESDHTVKVFELGEASDGPLSGSMFMVMDLVEGISLAERLKQGPLPLDEISLLLDHVADSVDEAHGKNVIHRDLKPSNILLTAHQNLPRAKVIDFGIARTHDSEQTMQGTALGTPGYMAPELWPSDQEEPITGRVDVYAMGVVLYQMLTGVKPFRSRDLLVLAACHRNHPVPPFAGEDVILSALEPVVMRAMEKSAVDRYPTLRAMAVDFERRLTDVAETYGKTESVSVPFMTPSGNAEFTTTNRSGSTSHAIRGVIDRPAAEPSAPRRSGLWIIVATVAIAAFSALAFVLTQPESSRQSLSATSAARESTMAAPEAPDKPTAAEAPDEPVPSPPDSGANAVGLPADPTAESDIPAAPDVLGGAEDTREDVEQTPAAEPPRPSPPKKAEAQPKKAEEQPKDVDSPAKPRAAREPTPADRPARAADPEPIREKKAPDPDTTVNRILQRPAGASHERALVKALDECRCTDARAAFNRLRRERPSAEKTFRAEVADCSLRYNPDGTCEPRGK